VAPLGEVNVGRLFGTGTFDDPIDLQREQGGQAVMNRKRAIAALLVVMVLCVVSSTKSHCQPTLPEEEIPSYLPDDIRLGIESLYSPRPLDRARAANELGEMGRKASAAIPFLAAMLGDGSALPLMPAYRSGMPESTPGVSTSPGEEAAKALAKIDESRALDLLGTRLKKGDRRVRYAAISGLGIIGDPAVKPLIAALKDPDRRVRRGAAWALGEIRAVRAVEPLIATMKDGSPEVRKDVAWALGEIGDSRAVEPLIRALSDSDDQVHWNAEGALAKMGEPAVKPLIAALKNPDGGVRQGAAWALGEVSDVRAVEPLIGMLRDDNEEVRVNAAWALRQIFWRLGDRSLSRFRNVQVIEPLIDAIDDKSEKVREYVGEILGLITKKNFGQNPLKWQEWCRQHRGRFAKVEE
jgi:HEAT repeat protein